MPRPGAYLFFLPATLILMDTNVSNDINWPTKYIFRVRIANRCGKSKRLAIVDFLWASHTLQDESSARRPLRRCIHQRLVHTLAHHRAVGNALGHGLHHQDGEQVFLWVDPEERAV